MYMLGNARSSSLRCDSSLDAMFLVSFMHFSPLIVHVAELVMYYSGVRLVAPQAVRQENHRSVCC